MTRAMCNLVVAGTITALTGCATVERFIEENRQKIEIAITCIIGGTIGYVVSGPRGAVVGCVAAGALAWVITDYQATQARTAASDAKKYRRKDPDFYAMSKPVDAPMVKIRKGTATPAKVKPGEQVVVSVDVSLAVPENVGALPVEYSLTLEKDGKTLSRMSPGEEDRDSGGWVYKTPINIPKEAEPGLYVITQRVSTGSTSYDEKRVEFRVAG